MSVPGRPARGSVQEGRPLASVTLTDGPRFDLLGLLAKYNWQYRRPFPQYWNVKLDAWRLMADGKEFDMFRGKDYHVRGNELQETSVWQKLNVDWEAWACSPSSMLVPTTTCAPSSSAVGDSSPVRQVYVRRVVTINFPALCWLLRKNHSAAEVEEAWLRMPLVKCGKKNRSNWK